MGKGYTVMGRERDRSRRKTIWDGKSDLTDTQSFIQSKIIEHYEQRHPDLSDSGEANLINSFAPAKCPYCGSEHFKRNGRTSNGIQRYHCVCGRTFLPTTGTIFDEHRISISEWIEYCMNLFRHVSISVDSWNNRNAFTTSRYWLQKVFLTLAGSQDDIILSGDVWLDETFYPLISSDIQHNEDGTKLRGISRNQLCIGVATDKTNTIFLLEGLGKPTQQKTFETFAEHIRPGSTLIHDREQAHAKLVRELSLRSEIHSSAETKGLRDSQNPMYPVNHQHALLMHFLKSHTGFSRENIQGFLDLFAFVNNPPSELEAKVEKMVIWAFENPKLLRYRDFFSGKSNFFKDE